MAEQVKNALYVYVLAATAHRREQAERGELICAHTHCPEGRCGAYAEPEYDTFERVRSGEKRGRRWAVLTVRAEAAELLAAFVYNFGPESGRLVELAAERANFSQDSPLRTYSLGYEKSFARLIKKHAGLGQAEAERAGRSFTNFLKVVAAGAAAHNWHFWGVKTKPALNRRLCWSILGTLFVDDAAAASVQRVVGGAAAGQLGPNEASPRAAALRPEPGTSVADTAHKRAPASTRSASKTEDAKQSAGETDGVAATAHKRAPAAKRAARSKGDKNGTGGGEQAAGSKAGRGGARTTKRAVRSTTGSKPGHKSGRAPSNKDGDEKTDTPSADKAEEVDVSDSLSADEAEEEGAPGLSDASEAEEDDQ
jgi:hypothetical protein